jgi:hypothetical protein
MMDFLTKLFRAPERSTAPAATPKAPDPASPASPVASRIIFRATQQFMDSVRHDLERRHAFAFERVGFITTRAVQGTEGLVILADGYHPVADDDYVPDSSVGAMLGSEALRKALELALLQGAGVFHVHMHGAAPRLWFSGIDLREQVRFIPDFFTVCPQMPHGAIVLDAKRAAGRVWLAPDRIVIIDEFGTVGGRLVIERTGDGRKSKLA